MNRRRAGYALPSTSHLGKQVHAKCNAWAQEKAKSEVITSQLLSIDREALG